MNIMKFTETTDIREALKMFEEHPEEINLELSYQEFKWSLPFMFYFCEKDLSRCNERDHYTFTRESGGDVNITITGDLPNRSINKEIK